MNTVKYIKGVKDVDFIVNSCNILLEDVPFIGTLTKKEENSDIAPVLQVKCLLSVAQASQHVRDSFIILGTPPPPWVNKNSNELLNVVERSLSQSDIDPEVYLHEYESKVDMSTTQELSGEMGIEMVMFEEPISLSSVPFSGTYRHDPGFTHWPNGDPGQEPEVEILVSCTWSNDQFIQAMKEWFPSNEVPTWVEEETEQAMLVLSLAIEEKIDTPEDYIS